MDVIGAMTVATTTIDSLDLCQRHSVAFVTANVDMCAVQGEICLPVVIEGPDIPRNRVMAVFAAILEIAFMLVVVAMAGHAANVFIRKCLGGMTTVTFLLFVNAMQRESCQVVIEEHRILPVEFRVAAFTLAA